ncbi:3D domain-containing protein [Salinisphaera sp.]|uniref:3D domain-containing protein n=1 Tax=Salinisphaera sp. TaxID=1914330 RepID=UPI00345D73D4|tara:strand:+ start:1226 stop:1627 length:402 start_codon:yes stop_codon:yes gene_type:complete
MIKNVCAAACLWFGVSIAQAAPDTTADWQSINVVASAYNSLPAQTSAEPTVAAWGDRLKPGMNAIAVSRDLIKKGLTHGTKVRIKGLPGVYIVRDKMASRWKNKIDIYMGRDVTAALEWGVRHDIEIEYAENS